jgi:hypothetical protein
MSQRKVERVICPDVSLPADMLERRKLEKKRKFTQQTEDSIPDVLKKSKFTEVDTEAVSTKQELRKYMSSIKEFNAKSELGKSKKKYEEDLLSQLGAPTAAPPKTPFPLKLKLDAARKIRENRKLEEMKQSDEVTTQHQQLLRKNKLIAEKKKNLRTRNKTKSMMPSMIIPKRQTIQK